MATVASPEPKVVDGGGGRDQSVSQFDVVALGKLPQVVPCALTDLGFDWDAVEGGKKDLESSVFLGASAVPELGNGNRRTKQGCLTEA